MKKEGGMREGGRKERESDISRERERERERERDVYRQIHDRHGYGMCNVNTAR